MDIGKVFDGAIRDEQGFVDIANLGMFIITGLAIAALLYTMVMTALSWAVCHICTFEPIAFGGAVTAIFGGYSTGLLALAAYMAATRPHAGVVAQLSPLPTIPTAPAAVAPVV